MRDLQDLDADLSKNILWILEKNLDDEPLEYDFSDVMQVFGETKIIELVENGQNIMLTEKNKKDFVISLCTAKMTKNISDQTRQFIKGIEDVIPADGFNLFTEQEFGLLLAGMPTVDRKKQRKNKK